MQIMLQLLEGCITHLHITKLSITAAFTKDQKLTNKEEKNQVEVLLGLPSKKPSNLPKTPAVSTEAFPLKENSKAREIENVNMEVDENKQEISGHSDQSAYNSEVHTPEPQLQESSDSDINEEAEETNSMTGENEDDQEDDGGEEVPAVNYEEN